MSITLGGETVIPTQIPGLSISARALYDNIAESPDELAFRRGDVLTVLERDTAGSDGWWLCSLRGRQGICPGNRLRLINSSTESISRRRGRTGSTVTITDLTPTLTKMEEVEVYDVPRTPVPASPCSLSSSLASASLYDVPVSRTHAPSAASGWYDSPRASSVDSAYDVPRARALPLACDAALDTMDRLHEEAAAAVTRLLAFVRSGWRARDELTESVHDVRVAAARVRAAIHDLAAFADATLANAAEAQDKGLAVKLKPLVKALKDAERVTHEAMTALDAGDWAIDRLVRTRESNSGAAPDALDSLVSCARSLTEDVKRTASFVRGNATLLFRRSVRPDWTDECDYVKLGARDDLPADDRRLVSFYATQAATYGAHLTGFVDAFARAAEAGEPPASFLARAKLLALGAHRLVLIGDAVHRHATHSGLRARALRLADGLSDALAETVSATKLAAARFPCASSALRAAGAARALAAAADELRRGLVRAAATATPTPLDNVTLSCS